MQDMDKQKIFKPTKQRFNHKRIFAFDIETYNNNKNFLMCSLVGYDFYGHQFEKVFYDKKSFVNELKTNHVYRNSIIFATNLSFDFFGMFFKNESENFRTLFRGSDLLSAKTYFNGDSFTSRASYDGNNKKCRKSLLFLDSLNYAKMSVKKMGDVIGMPKFEHPEFLGKKPSNEKEWAMMLEYNIRDSWITYHFMKFLIDAFEGLGATFKTTIASTSMSLYRNKYLEHEYFRHEKEDLLEIFKAYYGGRTEAFKRGYFTDANYYDFNSLYPSVMHDMEFPDPNTKRESHENTRKYIDNFEGVSDVDIQIPYSKSPILPFRDDTGKVLFPYGKLSGWYSHIELRKVMEEGAILLKVRKTHYYKEMCRPFKAFVADLYSKRMEFKKDNNPMQMVVKLAMNSLYGKFGQKFIDKSNTIHMSSVTQAELDRFKHIDRVGDYLVVTQDAQPTAFCIPIWAVYVTAYGRLKLYDQLKKHDVIYCDTDSIITKDEIKTSNDLGDLKLEMHITEGIVVRPKFYALKHVKDGEEVPYVKIKGLGKRLNYYEFVGLLHMPKIPYEKFAKFKEAIRRDFIPNEIIKVHKEFSLEDEKRVWKGEFDYKVFEDSCPMEIIP